jgi:nucleoside-triphosphatase THEP1
MRIAFVTCPGRGQTDAFLALVAKDLTSAGLRLAGTVQSNIHRPEKRLCDMDLRVLPDGPVLRISEDRGDLARGCRLDSGVLEQGVVEVMARLDGADLLIVNKFGKREAEGRGLVTAIAAAVEADMPVLVGVNALNLDAFRVFCGRFETALPIDLGVVRRWCLDSLRVPVGA